jgi:hypothetical protein
MQREPGSREVRKVDAVRAYGHDVGQEFAHWIGN